MFRVFMIALFWWSIYMFDSIHGRNQDFWFWGVNFGWSLGENVSKRKQNFPLYVWLFQLVKYNIETYMPNLKKANGLQFVWGVYFCFGVLSSPPPSSCLATSLTVYLCSRPSSLTVLIIIHLLFFCFVSITTKREQSMYPMIKSWACGVVAYLSYLSFTRSWMIWANEWMNYL